jgi:3-oxoacyl-[acyl-carrier protein] reductase|tara:strand:- start:7097 stop:7768 length:672 start_codon:yes stop_codon:yes gene_type:complete
MRALILGGKGDIGQAIATKLQSQSCAVDAVGRDDFDLTSTDQIKRYFEINKPEFDILVHSAGFNNLGLFEQTNDEDLRHSIEANLFGFLEVARNCLPYWKNKGCGRVLVISSLYGFLARSGRLPYVISKHGLNGAVKTLAIELAPYGVLVNSLSPGYIGTKMTYQNNSEETIAKLVLGIPLGRLGSAEDIAEVAEFLCSKKNKYINGQDIVVDGGFSIDGFQN